MSLAQYKQQFAEIVAKPVDEQAGFFLRAFVLDFQGKFEEVLEMGTAFKKFLPETGNELEVRLRFFLLGLTLSYPCPFPSFLLSFYHFLFDIHLLILLYIRYVSRSTADCD